MLFFEPRNSDRQAPGWLADPLWAILGGLRPVARLEVGAEIPNGGGHEAPTPVHLEPEIVIAE